MTSDRPKKKLTEKQLAALAQGRAKNPHNKKNSGDTLVQQKGGRASGEAKRAQRNAREWAELMLSLPMHDGEVTAPSTGDRVKDANMTMAGAMMASMLSKAIKGDTKAADLVLRLSGQLEERITVRHDPYEELTTEELRRLADDDDTRRGQAEGAHHPRPSLLL